MATEIIEAPQADIKDIVLYNDVRSELMRLETENAKTVFNYDDPKGEKAARSHIYEMRQVKGNIERERKRLKSDALEFGRKVDSAAKELTNRVEGMIRIHQEPLDRIAQREADRVAAIQAAIDIIHFPRLDLGLQPTAAAIHEAANTLSEIVIDADVYQERMAEATKLKADELAELEQMFESQSKREAEAAELDRLRKEAAAREQADREAKIAAEAEARARAEAEAKAKAEREAAEKRERELVEAAERSKREAAEAEERAKREAIEAEQRAKADADRRVKEAEAAAERKAQAERERAEREAAAVKAADAKREADKKHVAKVKSEAVDAIQTVGGVDLHTARLVIDVIASGSVPNVSIRF